MSARVMSGSEWLHTIISDVGFVGLWIGALSLLAGAVLIATAFVGWIVRINGWDKDDDER